MKVHDLEQGSSAWFALRRGLVTASEIDSLVAPLFKLKTGDAVQSYVYRKVCEKSLGYSMDEISASGGSWAMNQGKIVETIALPWYEFSHDVKIRRVGFCTGDDGRCGCSPDGLIGEDGGIEIKSPQPTTHVSYLLDGVVPEKYLTQIQFSMYVTGRPWWIFCSYSRHFTALEIRVERDPNAQAAIQQAMTLFVNRFDESLAKLTALKEAAK